MAEPLEVRPRTRRSRGPHAELGAAPAGKQWPEVEGPDDSNDPAATDATAGVTEQARNPVPPEAGAETAVARLGETMRGAGDPAMAHAEIDLDGPQARAEHRKLLSWFYNERSLQSVNRLEMSIDADFYDNRQWREEDAAILRSRYQMPLVYNEVAPMVDWLIGTERRTRVDWRVLPRTEDDVQLADVKTKVLKFVSDINRVQFARSRSFADAVKVGVGWLDDGVRDDPTQDPIYSKYEDWRNVLWDSASYELDLSDARYVFRWRWVDEDVALTWFPHRAAQIKAAASDLLWTDDFEQGDGDSGFTSGIEERERRSSMWGAIYRADQSEADNARRRVRLIEAQYRTPAKVAVVTDGPWRGAVAHPADVHLLRTLSGGAIVERTMMRVHVAVVTENDLLSWGPSIFRHNRFSLTPIWCYRDGRTRLPYGAIRRVRDIQEDINKRASKANFLTNSNQLILEDGATDDIESLREEAKRPDGVLIGKKGFRFEVRRDAEQVAAQLELMRLGAVSIQKSAGVADENMGRQTNAVSGEAIKARQLQGSVVTTEPFDNLRLAVAEQGQKQLSLIEQFYTEPKVARISGAKGAIEWVKVNQPEVQPDGSVRYVNDITASMADFVVSEQDYAGTMRQVMFEQLANMASKIAPDMALRLMTIAMEFSDLPNKDQIAAEFRRLTNTPDPTKPLTPEEEQAAEQQLGGGDLFAPPQQRAEEFVPAPGGGIDYGAITPEMAQAMRRQAGPIRLQQGDESFGLRHIDMRHGDDIRALGFKSVEDFVSEIAKNIDQVWKPSATTQLVAVEQIGKDRLLFIELKPADDGDYYRVNTAFPARPDYARGKNGWKLLWEARAQATPNAGLSAPFAAPTPSAGESATVPSGQSSGRSVAQPVAPDMRGFTLSPNTTNNWAKTVPGDNGASTLLNIRKAGGQFIARRASRFGGGITGAPTVEVGRFASFEEAADALGQPAQQPAARIEDVGEKIGGARKDTAARSEPRGERVEPEDPGWRRRYEVSEIVASATAGEKGRWTIRDTRRKDWKGQARQIGNSFATKEEAEAAVPLAEVARNHRVRYVKDDAGNAKYAIWRMVSDRKSVQVVPQLFDSEQEASRYMAEHAVSIIETRTSFGEEILPRPDNVRREGPQRRQGDVKGEDFLRDFGFRGVEFGNWEAQDERQTVMNHAYDALMDLADVLGVPPKAIGLNGELALAFGARGTGLSYARAHYERDYGVINLTKMKGAGSLAHEWMHAADHYFGRQDGKASGERVRNERGDTVWKSAGREDYASHGTSDKSRMRAELKAAYDAVMDTLRWRAEQYVEDTQRADRFVAEARDDVARRLQGMRSYLERKAEYASKKEPATAEQLARFDEIADKILSGEYLEMTWRQAPGAKGMSGYRWSNDGLDALSALYKEVRGRSGMTAQGGIVADLSNDMKRYGQRLKMLAEAQAQTAKTRKTPTEYAMEARRIDQGRASDYWSTPHELLARAFQSYVEDRVQGRSDFLTYGTNTAVPTPWGWARPFPQGAEREAINAAFDRFVKVLQTRETDRGTALFSRVSQMSGRDVAGKVLLVNSAYNQYGNYSGSGEVFLLDDGRVRIDGETVAPGDVLYATKEGGEIRYVRNLPQTDIDRIKSDKRLYIENLVGMSSRINRSVAKRSPSPEADPNDFESMLKSDRIANSWQQNRYPDARPGWGSDISRYEEVDSISEQHDPQAIEDWVVAQEVKNRRFVVGGYLHVAEPSITRRMASAIAAYQDRGGRLGKSALEALAAPRIDGPTDGSANDSIYSRGQGAGLTPQRTRQIVVARLGEQATAALERAGLLDIRATNDTGHGDSTVDGMLLNGRAYLFADALAPDTVVPVLMEELGEHYGLPQMLGPQYEKVVGRLRDMKAGGNQSVKRAWAEVERAYPDEAPGSRRFMHEVVAKLGRDAAARGTAWWRNLVAAVKRFLIARLGARFDLTPEDVGAMMEGALRKVVRDARARTMPAYYEDAAGALASQSVEALTERQFAETERAAGGREAYERAKADGKTKLGYRQWVQVRTPAFKAWWGYDWQQEAWDDGARENAAVVGRADRQPARGNEVGPAADVNRRRQNDGRDFPVSRRRGGDFAFFDATSGEPRVFFHGTRDDFSAFDVDHPNKKDAGWLGRGHYVTSARFVAENYARLKRGDGSPRVLELFVRPVNPYKLLPEHKSVIKSYTPEQLRRFNEQIRARGHNGTLAMFMDGAFEVAVFDAPSLKSATDNRGTFDANNPDIRYSRVMGAGSPLDVNSAHTMPPAPRRQQSIPAFDLQRNDIPSESRWRALRRSQQDYFLRVQQVQDTLAKAGGLVDDKRNVYLAEERSYGRMEARMTDFKRHELAPMLKTLADAGLTVDDLAIYAYAKFAPERNAYIAGINPDMPEAGSGMSDGDAQAVLDKAEAEGHGEALRAAHAQLMGIVRATRKAMLDDGLITRATFDLWESQYPNYVPLRGFENVDEEAGSVRAGAGRGIDIRGPETLRALGRRSRAGDIIENVIAQRERAVSRGERNRIGQVFLDLVTTNPDPSLWEIDAKRTVRSLGADGLVVDRVTADTSQDTVAVKVRGETVYVKVNDDLLLRAMKRMADNDEAFGLLWQSAQMYRNWLSMTLTRYNPGWVIPNMARDFQAGMAALVADAGVGAGVRYTRHYKSALAAAWRDARDTQNPDAREWDRWMRELQSVGGTTGGFHMRELGDIRKEIDGLMARMGVLDNAKTKTRAAINRAKRTLPYRAAAATFELIDHVGRASENASRLAAYRAARESGMSIAQAASIAKNLTTNFNRFGEAGRKMNALYLFYNAAVQGSVRVAQTVAKPRGLAWLAMTATIPAAALALLGGVIGGDDDDGVAYWDKIPWYEKERNLIVMLPPGASLVGAESLGKDGKGRYIKIPLPYGYNAFNALGYAIGEVMRNRDDPARGLTPMRAAKNLALTTFSAFNPISGLDPDNTDGEALALGVAPTLADLPLQIAFERNAFGRPTAPEARPWDLRPDSQRMFASHAGGAAARIAQWMNEATGGSAVESGRIDLAPGTIETVARQAAGGVGQFGMDVANTVSQMLTAENDINARNLPILRSVYGETDAQNDTRMFRERVREIERDYRVLRNRAQLGLPIDVEESEANKMAVALYGLGNKIDSVYTDLRKREIAVRTAEDITDERRRAELRQIETDRARLARVFNQRYDEQRRAVAGN